MPDPSPNMQRLERALQANAPFRALADALADALLIVSEARIVVYASDRVQGLLNRAPEEMVGQPFLNLFHEEDRADLPAQMEQGGPGVQWAARMLDRDGGSRWVSLGLRRPDGAEPEGTYVLVRPFDEPPDITDAAVLFQRALDAANNFVVITDARRADNPIVFVNDFFLEATGYDEDEVLGRNCRFLQFRPDGTRDEQPERDELRTKVDAGEPAAVLMRNYRKDGTLFWNELYVTPLFDTSGALTHFIGVQNDVTERVEAVREVQQREALLRSFFESAPVMMGVTELEDGVVTHRSANSSAARFYEVEAGAIAGKTERELGYTERESGRWKAHYLEALNTGAPVRFDTYYPWDEDPEGEGVRTLAVALNHIPDTERPAMFSYIVEDVTERRRNERGRRLLEQAIENTTAAFLITEDRLERPGPIVTYVNPAFTKMTGYTKGDIVGRTPRILQGPKTDRALLDRLRRQLKAGRRFHGETVNYRKDGTEYVLNWSIEPIRDHDGTVTHWVATQDDVTQQRELEQEVLEVSAREQERIARDLHDGLGQVLTGVSFLAATVESRLRDEGSPHAGELERIKTHVQEAISQARELAHGLHPVNVEADGLVKALAHLAETVEATYGVSCSFVYNRLFLIDDHTMAAHLYRIAQEAISNAIRHGSASEVAISLQDTAAEGDASSEAAGTAILSITDDGTGISDEALQESAGMGVHTMRNRARRIGGTLEVGRRPEGGTYVRCWFDPDETQAVQAAMDQ